MNANSDIRIPNETERRGQAFLRALPIMLIPLFVGIAMALVVSAVVGGVPFSEDGQRRGNPLVPVIVMTVFFTALIALVRFGRPNLSSVIFIGVWTLLTTLFGLQSGINGFWAALLIVPICAAGLLIDGVASISLAALATLLIIVLGLLEWLGIVSPEETIPPLLTSFAPFLSAGFWIGIFWTVAGLTYVLSNSLQRALKSSRAQAQELKDLSASLEARVHSQTAELLEQSRQAAIVEERARVARDIHDTLAQGLTGIVVQLGAAQRAMQFTEQDTDPTSKEHVEAHHAAIEHLTLAQGMAREALAEARRSIWNLRASSLERGELNDALAGLAARASNETTRVTFEAHGDPWQLSADVESALLRVAQEGLVNAAKHSNATEVDVALEYSDDMVRLEIHDNGVGLDEEALNDASAIKNPASGFGLMGMRERLAQWGGELKLTNEDGAKVEATIPRGRAERVDALSKAGDGRTGLFVAR
jgi:signal transduction histidine kinase